MTLRLFDPVSLSKILANSGKSAWIAAIPTVNSHVSEVGSVVTALIDAINAIGPVRL
jgi:hypothetical protein